MTLKNAEITNEIEQLSNKIIRLLKHRNALATSRQEGSLPRLKATINELLGNAAKTEQAISLEDLDNHYRNIMGESLFEPKAIQYSEQNKKHLAKAITVHLKAIICGFEETLPAHQARNQTKPNVERARHVHHYHHSRDNFWRDRILYQMLFGNNHQHHGSYYPNEPRAPLPNQSEPNKKEGLTAEQIIAGLMLVGAALATLGYDIAQIYYRLEQIAYHEDIPGNTAKLTATAMAAWQGYLIGTIIGASYLSLPLLSGVCTAIIAACVGMAASKWAVKAFHQTQNSQSALASDPRYCLTKTQKINLILNGINPDVVNEALRECAIQIKNEPTNGLIFWQNPNADLIALVRKLKCGIVPARLKIDVKCELKNGNKVILTKEFNMLERYVSPFAQGDIVPSAPPLPANLQNETHGYSNDPLLDRNQFLASPSAPPLAQAYRVDFNDANTHEPIPTTTAYQCH